MSKIKFEIGETVYVSKVSTMEYVGKRGDKRVAVKHGYYKFAKIVGAKHKKLGDYIPKSGSYRPFDPNGNDDFEQAYLAVTGTVLLWEIKEGYLNKTFLTSEEEINKVTSDDMPKKKFPWKAMPFDKEARDYLSKEMKAWPRDKNGKWVKDGS